MTETGRTVERLRNGELTVTRWIPEDEYHAHGEDEPEIATQLAAVIEAAQDWAKARAAFMETGGSDHPDYKARGTVLALAEQNLLAALHSQASDEGKQ